MRIPDASCAIGYGSTSTTDENRHHLRPESDAPPAGRPARRLPGRVRQPATIEAIAAVLRGLGHEVVKLGDGRELLRTAAGRAAGFRLQLRRRPGHRPVARGARAGRAGDARHSLHRLRSADPGRHAGQGLRQAAGRIGAASRFRAGVVVSRTRTRPTWQRADRLPLPGHRQAGLGRIEQGHSRQVRGRRRRRSCRRRSSRLRRTIGSRSWSRSSSRATS